MRDIEFIEKVKHKANSYMSRNIVRHASCVLQRSLYSYAGVYRKDRMSNYLSGVRNEARNNHNNNYNYPFNCLYSSYDAYGSQNIAVQGLVNNVENLFTHYDIPYYTNYISALYSNIVTGLTKGSINCKYIELRRLNVEEDFLSIDKELKRAAIVEQWKPAMERLASHKQLMLKGNRDKPQEILATIAQDEDRKIQEAQEELEASLKTLDEKYDERFFKKLNLIESQSNLIVDKIGQEINNILHDQNNINSLAATLETFMSTGFAVIKVCYDEKKHNFYFEPVNRPEACFFSSICIHKDKSDSRFCAQVRAVDRLVLAEEYNLTEEEVEAMQDFPPVSVGYGTFFLPYGASERDYIIICDYYYKKDNKIHKVIMSGDTILKREELKYFDRLPLIYLDTSGAEQLASRSVFFNLFPIQHSIADKMVKLQVLIDGLSSAKLVMGEVEDEIRNKLNERGWLEGPILFVPTKSGTNESMPATNLPAAELPQTLLAAIEQEFQKLQYMTQIQNSQFISTQPTLGAVSGVAIENADMKQEKSWGYFIDEIEKTLTTIFQWVIVPNLYHTFVNKDNLDEGVEKYMLKLFKESGEDLYKKVARNINLQMEWVVDPSLTRNRTNLLLKDIAGMVGDESVKEVILKEIILNSDLAGGGNTIIEKIDQAKKDRVPQQDPMLALQGKQVELAQQQLQLEAQKINSDASLKQEEIVMKEKKDLRDISVKMYDIAEKQKKNANDIALGRMAKASQYAINLANNSTEAS